MELCPPLHLSVEAIEKGAVRSPLTEVANFTFTFNEKRNSYLFSCKTFNKSSCTRKILWKVFALSAGDVGYTSYISAKG